MVKYSPEIKSTIFIFGFFMFKNNLNNSSIIVQLKNKTEYRLIRVISRGVIVQNEKYTIKFILLDEVNQFSKDIKYD